MKIAIIGAGISGLGAAYLLSPEHDITLYEKNDYVGGHSRTVIAPVSETKKLPVDTGFIVFNDWNYPHLMGLFKTLDVPYQKSTMSFGVCIDKGWLEYASGGLLAQKINILRPAYWRMIFDIIKFNKQAPAYLEKNSTITLKECLRHLGMGPWFTNYYILAMGASIWSCPVDSILDFPAKTFVQFFKNHGLLNIKNRPQWYTVTGGSREYVRRILEKCPQTLRLNMAAVSVTSLADGRVSIGDIQGQQEIYDHVIFACHADEAVQIFKNPTDDQKNVIGSFRFQENAIVLHGDCSFMPKRKKCWASWVYLSEQREDKNTTVSLSYWMNNLQSLDFDFPLIVTLNPERQPKADLVYDRHVFMHPIFDDKAIEAQKRIPEIQGQNNIWFCGAYQRYGFHEDGLLSAVHVAKALGARVPWE
jgi:predicted NAD/FAD-binding protein